MNEYELIQLIDETVSGMDRVYVTYTDQLYEQENGIFLGDGVVRPKRHTRLKNVVDVLDFDNFKE